MGLIDKAKSKAKEITGDLKEQENANKALANASMEERVKMRPEGVRYCIVNSFGKILDVYDNKVVFTSTKSTSTVVSGLIFGDSLTQGEKTIYYKDAIGVQFKPATITDGYIQVETAVGGMTSAKSQYGGENSIQFGSKVNDEAETVTNFIKQKIEEIKNTPVGGTVIQQSTAADEVMKLKQLLDMGVISQEEFDKKKNELLGL
jgi:hypothetical protein